MTDFTQGQILSVAAVALSVMIIFLIGWHVGRHGRQHWETDRIVEGKLASLLHRSAGRNTSWEATNDPTVPNGDGLPNLGAR